MKFRSALIWLVVVLVVAMLVPHLWPDEDLSPEAQRFLARPQIAASEPRTLAYGLLGFEAPSGQDIWAQGRFQAAAYLTLGTQPEAVGTPVKFTVTSNDLCKWQEKDCWQKTVAALPELPALLEANAEPLARYAALHEARSFDEATPLAIDSPMPRYTNLTVGQRLTLRRASREFLFGDRAAAWRILEVELLFHRRMVAESGSLIGKMIALSLLEQDLRLHALWADQAAREGTAGAKYAIAPPRLTLPERSMVRTMGLEATFLLNMIDSFAKDSALAELMGADSPALLFRLLPFKRNATLNRAITPSLTLARNSLLSARELVATQATADKRLVKPIDWYLNGAGAVLMDLGPDYDQYLMRIHDLDALIVLNQVAGVLRATPVTAADVGVVLDALPDELRSPFDGAAPKWQDGVLSFDTGAREPKFELRVPVTLAQ